MSEAPRLHEERDRAESFGSVADAYDRYRPSFPAALFDDLLASAPRSVLDVAAGTGKVARAIATRGVRVMGVEIDARMAAVARRHGIPIDVAKFEDWDDAGRSFDLVVCGDAWHWIDPARGAEKVARVLERGKTFARFFNVQVLDDDAVRALEGPYREHGKGAILQGQRFDGELPRDPLADDPRFEAFDLKTYRWERAVRVDDWIAFMGTLSDHVRLGREGLAALQQAAREALAPFGDTIRVDGRTYAAFATRA
jgi:SAM-dependent methyltransferase